MTYIVECFHENRTSDKRRFVGPFQTRAEANVYTELPVWGSSECEGTHTVHEMNTPAVEPMDFSTVVRMLERQQARSEQEAIERLARNSVPFGVGMDGRIETGTIVDQFGIANGVETIKELRTRYPGLGLKEAKEIVEEWHTSRSSKPLFGKR